jgi:hypothetical protein
MLGLQTHVTFKEDTHQYFDPQGIEFTSVSKVIQSVTPKFDRDRISMAMAKKKAMEEGIELERAHKLILQDWDHKKNSALDRGNWIHDNIEAYLTMGSCDEKLTPLAKQIAHFASGYYKYFPEALLYDSDFNVAGQSDLVLQRTKKADGVVDFFDYKTNERKGIYFDSVRRKDGVVVKHYNQFLGEPLGHLEYCNYNTYSLQLSLYAYMAAQTFGIAIGRLGIIFIDNKLKIKVYPVPYMKMEVIALLKHWKDRNKSGWEE